MLWVLCGTHVPQAVGLARVKTRPWIGPCLTFLHCVFSKLESGKEEGENQALDRPRLLSGQPSCHYLRSHKHSAHSACYHAPQVKSVQHFGERTFGNWTFLYMWRLHICTSARPEILSFHLLPKCPPATLRIGESLMVSIEGKCEIEIEGE